MEFRHIPDTSGCECHCTFYQYTAKVLHGAVGSISKLNNTELFHLFTNLLRTSSNAIYNTGSQPFWLKQCLLVDKCNLYAQGIIFIFTVCQSYLITGILLEVATTSIYCKKTEFESDYKQDSIFEYYKYIFPHIEHYSSNCLQVS